MVDVNYANTQTPTFENYFALTSVSIINFYSLRMCVIHSIRIYS